MRESRDTTDELYRYLYEFRISFSDDHWGHRIVSCVMDIFDETQSFVKARPRGCPKLFTFYKHETRPVREEEIDSSLPKMVLIAVDRRRKTYSPDFSIYVVSHNPNKRDELEQKVSLITSQALDEIRLSGGKRPF